MRTFSQSTQWLALSLLGLGLGLSSQTQAAGTATQVTAKASSNYAQTKYPILMVHGWLGWSRIGTDTVGLDYGTKFCLIWHVTAQQSLQHSSHLPTPQLTVVNN